MRSHEIEYQIHGDDLQFAEVTLDPGETCDDANDIAGDGCSVYCTGEDCGDGVLDPGEQCEDANLVGGDGCSDDCLFETTAGCGGREITDGTG